MTKNEFSEAVKLAKDSTRDLSAIDDSIVFGCGLPDFNNGQKLVVTLEIVAKFIRWQCQYLGGGWDMEEMQNCFWIAKRKFLLVG